MDAVMQKEGQIAIIVAVVVIVAIIAGRGLRNSRRQLILDPRKDPQEQTKVDLLNDAKLEDSEMGNMTGASGFGGPVDAKMLENAHFKNAKVKDITGVSTGPRHK